MRGRPAEAPHAPPPYLQVSLRLAALLHAEVIKYSQEWVEGSGDLEDRLAALGRRVGFRLAELLQFRSGSTRREVRILGLLYHLNGTVWKTVTGKMLDSLEKSTARDDEYMVTDNENPTTRFTALPREMAEFNCAAYHAGIIAGVLYGAGFVGHLLPRSPP